MERLRYRSTSVLDLQAELRQRALLDEADRDRAAPQGRRVGSRILRMLIGRLRG